MCAFWRRDGYRVTEWVPNSLLFKNPSTCPHLEVRKKNPLPKRDHFMPIAVVKISGHGFFCQKYTYFIHFSMQKGITWKYWQPIWFSFDSIQYWNAKPLGHLCIVLSAILHDEACQIFLKKSPFAYIKNINFILALHLLNSCQCNISKYKYKVMFRKNNNCVALLQYKIWHIIL